MSRSETVDMNQGIETQFDEQLNAYIVSMPAYVSLAQLQAWTKEFVQILNERESGEKAAILLDTNRHKFESIECLKFLRDFLSEAPAIVRNISHAAFVSPKDTRPARVVSSKEAYFNEYDDAYQWLREKV